jgi:ribulose-phosphate 3-epimerase
MFSTSIMCVNQLELKSYIDLFNKYNFGMIHIDIMDGRFVNNIMYGPYILNDLRKYTNLKFDIHLMIDKPEYKINMFNFSKNDRVSIHYESTKNLMRTILEYKKVVGEVFVAINPATPISVLEEVIDIIDGVLIMCVNPGFASQDMMHNIPSKLRKIREVYPNLKIEVDGHITPEYYEEFSKLNIQDFVLGTSFLFKGDINHTENIIKSIVENE